MKIQQGDLESGEVSTVKKITSYDKQKYNLERSEPEKAFQNYGQQLAEEHDFKIVSTVKEAVEGRMNSEKVITLREADTLARKGIKPEGVVLAAMMSELGGYVLEDNEGGDDIWFLRHRYNKGLEWKKNVRHLRGENDQIAGDNMIKGLIDSMMEKELPPWPEEYEHGFPIELTKPEYMTWDQYTKVRKKGRAKEVDPHTLEETNAQ